MARKKKTKTDKPREMKSLRELLEASQEYIEGKSPGATPDDIARQRAWTNRIVGFVESMVDSVDSQSAAEMLAYSVYHGICQEKAYRLWKQTGMDVMGPSFGLQGKPSGTTAH